MRQYLPPWLRALTAEPGSRDAKFDWNDWVLQIWREMRTTWIGYFVLASLFMGLFSCVSAQMDAQIEAGAAREKPKVDPWALEQPVGAGK